MLTVFKAEDLEEAIQISNSVKFGLSSSVYTKDLTRAFQYINTVDAGMVHVNAPTLGGEVHLPFGGLKSSGVGQREQGVEAFDFFSEVITVYIDHARRPGSKRGLFRGTVASQPLPTPKPLVGPVPELYLVLASNPTEVNFPALSLGREVH